VKTAIECVDAGCRFEDGRWVLRDLTVRIPQGARVGLIGPNGAGKTTLLLMLVGIRPVSAGEVRVLGLDPCDRATLPEIRRRVGFVFQEPDDQLFCASVFDDVAFSLRQAGIPETEVARRVEHTLHLVGLADEARSVSHHLSTGQKRRAALATALVSEPEVLLLDEPTNDLDPRGRRALEKILSDCPQTVLIASHDLEFVLRTCERVVLLDGGRVLAEGPSREILSDAGLMEPHGLEVPPSLRGRARAEWAESRSGR